MPQDLSESMGLSSLNARLQDPAAVDWVSGVFPKVPAPCYSAVPRHAIPCHNVAGGFRV